MAFIASGSNAVRWVLLLLSTRSGLEAVLPLAVLVDRGNPASVPRVSPEGRKLVAHLSTSLATLVMFESIYALLGLARDRTPCLRDEQQKERQAGGQTEKSRRHGESPGEQRTQQREDVHNTTQHAGEAQQQGRPEAPPGPASQSDSAGQGLKGISALAASIPQSRRPKRSIDGISDSEESGNERRIRFSTLAPRPSHGSNGHDLGSHLPWLVSLGLEAWEEDQSGKESTRDGEAPTSLQGASPFELPHRPLKRLRSSRSSSPRMSTRSSPAGESGGSSEEASQLLACPFYRHDPARHRGCVGDPTLTDADSVRYHVLARHRNPLHCPICYVYFERHADRDRHVVLRVCEPPPEPPADLLAGVSASQAAQLAVQDGRGTGGRPDPATCWNQIWDVLFPGQGKPAQSQFVTEEMETKAAGLRRFWSDKGLGLVVGALERKGDLGAGLRPDASLEALFTSVLDGMLASLEQKGRGDE